MPITPDKPFPKSPGDPIRSKDWNDLVTETQRLDNAKVDKKNGAISGSLTVAGSLGVKTDAPVAPLHVVGPALISDDKGYAVPNNRMAPGSLTIGSLGKSFGGGSNWNDNTAGLLLETLADTEIAVHDANTRLASIVRYESSTNSLTIGRDMGWGSISSLHVRGFLDVSDRLRSRQGAGGTAGIWLYQNGPKEDRAFIGMNGDNIVGLYGRKGANWALNMDVVTGNLGVRSNPVGDRSMHVNGASRKFGIVVSAAQDWAIYANGNTFTTGRAKDNKIHSTVAATNHISLALRNQWQDLPNIATTINIPVGGHFLILAQMNGVQGTGNDHVRGYFRILVDNTEVQRAVHEFNNAGWELRGVQMSELRYMAPGTHTIKVQWYVLTSNNGPCNLSCCWYGDKRQLQVIELS